MWRYSTYTFFLHGREWFEFRKGYEPPKDDEGAKKEPAEPAPKTEPDRDSDEEVKCGG